MVSNMLCVLAHVYMTEANCCYQMMHIASLSSCGTCLHIYVIPYCWQSSGLEGLCTVSIYIQYVAMVSNMLWHFSPCV